MAVEAAERAEGLSAAADTFQKRALWGGGGVWGKERALEFGEGLVLLQALGEVLGALGSDLVAVETAREGRARTVRGC